MCKKIETLYQTMNMNTPLQKPIYNHLKEKIVNVTVIFP